VQELSGAGRADAGGRGTCQGVSVVSCPWSVVL